MNGKLAVIDRETCFECGTCFNHARCPVDAIKKENLEWPRELRDYNSWCGRVSLISGRGTTEVKANDVSGRVKKGEVGIIVELGRPSPYGTYFRDVEKVAMALAAAGVGWVKENPSTMLMKDVKTGKMKDDILNEKCMSCILEAKVSLNEFRKGKVMDALKEVEDKVDTTFTVSFLTRMEYDGKVPLINELRKQGLQPAPYTKINVGLGRPLSSA